MKFVKKSFQNDFKAPKKINSAFEAIFKFLGRNFELSRSF